MKTRILLTLVTALLTGVVYAQKAVQPPPTPPSSERTTPYGIVNSEALRALRQMEEARKQSRQAYAKAIEPARTKLIASLMAIQGKLTKEGNLDEAVKLKNAIVEIKQQQDDPDAASALLKLLPETKWKHANGWVLTFHADMTVTSTHHNFKGCWVPLSDSTVRVSLSMESCSSLVLRIKPDGRGFINADTKEPYFTIVSAAVGK